MLRTRRVNADGWVIVGDDLVNESKPPIILTGIPTVVSEDSGRRTGGTTIRSGGTGSDTGDRISITTQEERMKNIIFDPVTGIGQPASQLERDADATNSNNTWIYIGVGVAAFLVMLLIFKKKK